LISFTTENAQKRIIYEEIDSVLRKRTINCKLIEKYCPFLEELPVIKDQKKVFPKSWLKAFCCISPQNRQRKKRCFFRNLADETTGLEKQGFSRDGVFARKC